MQRWIAAFSHMLAPLLGTEHTRISGGRAFKVVEMETKITLCDLLMN